jgi:hypothetical protein
MLDIFFSKTYIYEKYREGKEGNFFPKVFSGFQNWTKKMSKNQESNKNLEIFFPPLHN